jgi:hypothetical protein
MYKTLDAAMLGIPGTIQEWPSGLLTVSRA